MSPLHHRTLQGLVVIPLFLGVAACGSMSGMHTGSGTKSTSGTHTMADGSTMSDAQMKGMATSADKPTKTASMICGDEIGTAVQHTFELSAKPVGLSSYAAKLFSCTYQLPAGDLRMSVKDLDTAGPGQAYFDGLRSQLPDPKKIIGLPNFGFPAFETAHGDVVFIKDHKTLWVDASRLSGSGLPGGFSREDAAYAVAAAVIGCWTE